MPFIACLVFLNVGCAVDHVGFTASDASGTNMGESSDAASVPDLSVPDLSVPDLSVPDDAASSGDIFMPDLGFEDATPPTLDAPALVTDSGAHPDVCVPEIEVCNGRDDNCDGDIDEGFLEDWYIDRDGDGFGARGSSPRAACEQPMGWSSNSDDCNDMVAVIHPGVADNRCDGLDLDCDGSVDENPATGMLMGHRYRLCGDRLRRDRAADRCREMGGYLVTLSTEAEHEFVGQLTSAGWGTGLWWIGLTDREMEGMFVWDRPDADVVGDPLLYPWHPGTPNTDANDCVIMNGSGDPAHRWRPRVCRSQLRYICEYSPGPA